MGRGEQALALVGRAGLVGLVAGAACTFPDVDYADGGAGGSVAASTSKSTSGSGGECAGLATCTAAATSCANAADGVHTTCTQACKNPGCTMKCDQDQTMALMGCAATCNMLCTPGCADAPTVCMAAVGL